jgi:hypothetical protein
VASSPDNPDAGYITVAATLISLTIATVVSAILVLSLTELRRAKADLERVQVAALLDGGQLVAALTIFSNVQPGRLRWRESTSIGAFDILAEPERSKGAAGNLVDVSLLARLGAPDPAAAAAWLRGEAAKSHPAPIEEAAKAPLWRNCAASMLSYFGREPAPKLAAAAVPNRQSQAGRAGEVWRVRVGINGWVDDRLVRMTGADRPPAITISRSFYKGQSGGEPCASLITQG